MDMNTIIIIIGSVLIVSIITGFIIYLINIRMKYKHIIIMNDLMAHGVKRVKIYKFREWYDDGQIKLWRLWKEKDKLKRDIPVAPNEVIKTNDKGNMVVVAYRTETGELIYQSDNVKIKPVPADLYNDVPNKIKYEENPVEREKLLKEWKQAKYVEWKKNEGVSVDFEPYTTADRLTVHNNHKKILKRNKTSLWQVFAQNASLAIVLMFILIFVIIAVTNYKDLMQPSVDVQKERTSQLQIQKETVETLKEIKQDVQILKNQKEKEAPN